MKIKFLVIFLSVYTLLLGQSLSGTIKYNFTFFSGVELKSIPAYLYFNTEKSLFDYDKLTYIRKEDSLDKLLKQRKRDAYGQMYWIDKKTGILHFREFLFRKPYISQEKIPIIPWQLQNEVKTIAGYVCKKATATFRGRKYAAWYTSSIPVSVGPWKLQGLPGAILEVESEDGEVKFVAESIRIPADVQKELSLTELPEGKVVSYPEEYKKAFKQEQNIEYERVRTLLPAIHQKAIQEGIVPANMPVPTFLPPIVFTIEKYE